jgi:hypothetical protein
LPSLVPFFLASSPEFLDLCGGAEVAVQHFRSALAQDTCEHLHFL